jgi:ABC-type glycerol-3-phosphate transport system permease component
VDVGRAHGDPQPLPDRGKLLGPHACDKTDTAGVDGTRPSLPAGSRTSSPVAWDNYQRAFELVDLPRYALNSLIVAAFAAPLSVLVAPWAGFAASRLGERLRRRS